MRWMGVLSLCLCRTSACYCARTELHAGVMDFPIARALEDRLNSADVLARVFPYTSIMDSKEMEEAKLEAWWQEHRLRKRLSIINVIKSREEYECLEQSRQSERRSLIAVTPTPPTTPKPTGKEARRQWGRDLILWKAQLRKWMAWWKREEEFQI